MNGAESMVHGFARGLLASRNGKGIPASAVAFLSRLLAQAVAADVAVDAAYDPSGDLRLKWCAEVLGGAKAGSPKYQAGGGLEYALRIALGDDHREAALSGKDLAAGEGLES